MHLASAVLATSSAKSRNTSRVQTTNTLYLHIRTQNTSASDNDAIPCVYIYICIHSYFIHIYIYISYIYIYHTYIYHTYIYIYIIHIYIYISYIYIYIIYIYIHIIYIYISYITWYISYVYHHVWEDPPAGDQWLPARTCTEQGPGRPSAAQASGHCAACLVSVSRRPRDVWTGGSPWGFMIRVRPSCRMYIFLFSSL